MNRTRIWAIIQRVFVGMYRDRRAIPALILVPVGTVLLVGYAMRESHDTRAVALVVTAPEWAARDVSAYVEESLREDDIRTYVAANEAAAREDVREGDAEAYVGIDDGLVNGLLSGTAGAVTIGLRGDDQAATREVREAIGRALSSAPLKAVNASVGNDPLPAGPLEVEERYEYGGERFDALDHAFPALIAFASFLSIFTITIVAFTQERFTHVLERMLSTAATRREVVFGYFGGYTAEAAVQTGLIALVVFLVFDAEHAGSVALVTLITLLTAVTAVSLGLLLSAFAKTEQQAMQMLPFVMVPQFILAGVLFPLDSLPDGLRAVSHALPMTYSVQALTDVMIRGHGLGEASVLLNMAALCAFVLGSLALGARTLREAA
jgi:ABC-2 type transport system permease protein